MERDGKDGGARSPSFETQLCLELDARPQSMVPRIGDDDGVVDERAAKGPTLKRIILDLSSLDEGGEDEGASPPPSSSSTLPPSEDGAGAWMKRRGRERRPHAMPTTIDEYFRRPALLLPPHHHRTHSPP